MSFRHAESAKAYKADKDRKIAVKVLREYFQDWNNEARLRQHSPNSMRSRLQRMEKFFWFLDCEGFQEIGTPEIREFFLYLNEAHTRPGGRFGLTTPLRPQTVANYHILLNAFFRYLVSEELIDFDPMRKVKVVKPKQEIKAPVSSHDIKALLCAARATRTARRDEAIILTLLDTGMRAAELCSINRRDFDDDNLCIRIRGKGNKFRTVFVSQETYKAIRAYQRTLERDDEDTPLFAAKVGKHFTPSGLFQLMRRLARAANVKNPGVHQYRRAFAVSALKNSGGNLLAVSYLMGHGEVSTTQKYIKMTAAAVGENFAAISPVANLK